MSTTWNEGVARSTVGGGGWRRKQADTERGRCTAPGSDTRTTGTRAPGCLTICNLASHFSLFGSHVPICNNRFSWRNSGVPCKVQVLENQTQS